MGDYYVLNGMDSMPIVNHDDADDGCPSTAYNGHRRHYESGQTSFSTRKTILPEKLTLTIRLYRGFTSGRLAEKDAGGGEVLVDTRTGS